MFRKFLADILPEDVGFFMLRSLGYGLLGHAREHKLFILQGTGRNGKSTLLEIMTALFGALMVTIQPESLNGRMEGAIRNDLARLAGKRFMITSETKAGTVLDAPLVKQITGLDTLTARFLHKEFFEFQPCAVPFIVTNYLPVVDGSDFAMASRLLVIGFDTVIASPDNQLPEKLKAEASGILNLVLAGMKDYQANGLMIPASVAERSKTFIERSNLLKGFLDDMFEVADGGSVMANSVYRRYEDWCKDNGYRSMSSNQFKDAFERTTGIAQERNNQGRYWPNMRLKGGSFTI
jgi:putative DNA primase/helicase